MLFRSRMQGELVLSSENIRTRRDVSPGATISLSKKTTERFASSLLAYVRASKLVPLDDEAREFASPSKKTEPTPTSDE